VWPAGADLPEGENEAGIMGGRKKKSDIGMK
jgi:hypothetical protein